MLSSSNNIRCLNSYIIKSIVQYFSNDSETVTSRYVLYFESPESICDFDNDLRAELNDKNRADILKAKLGNSRLDLTILPDYDFKNNEGNIEFSATQLKIVNGSLTRTIVFIPDYDKEGLPLGDAFKNGIRNLFVDKNETKILFYLSMHNVASVSKTTENFQRQGMPLSIKNVYESLFSQLSVVDGINQQKLLGYSLDKIIANKPQNDTSLIEFAPIIRIIESQVISHDDFHDLHMFPMDLNDLGKKDCKLGENYKLFRQISLALNDRELETALSSSYESKIIKDLERQYLVDEEKWDMCFTYDGIEKYKKANAKRFKLEQPVALLDNDNNELPNDYYISFTKNNSASFVIFTKDYTKEKVFKLSLKFTLKATVTSNSGFDVEQMNAKGTHYRVVLNNDESFYQGSVEFKNGKHPEFKLYVSVMNVSLGFLADSCIGIKEENKQIVHLLESTDYVLTLGNDSNPVPVFVEVRGKNAETTYINPQQSTKISFKHPEDEAIKECGFKINVEDGVYIDSKVRFTESKLKTIALYELFNKCYIEHNEYNVDESTVYNINRRNEKYLTKEFDVSGNKYSLHDLLVLEKTIIASKIVQSKTSGLKDPQGESLSLPSDVQTCIDSIFDYFISNNTIPSLSGLSNELLNLYEDYIDAVLVHVGTDSSEFMDKKAISSDILNILKIGFVYDTEGLIWISPINPLSVAYQLQLCKTDCRIVELDDYLYSSLGFGNTLPFLTDDTNRIYQSICGGFPLQWACYCDAAQSIKGEESTYANKIQDYYSKFYYLFNNGGNEKFIINVINIQHTSEIIKALLKLYKNENSISQIAIEVNFYYSGTGRNDFDRMCDFSYVEEVALDYYGAKYPERVEGFTDWYSEKVSYYAMPDQGDYKYSHISFCAMQGENNKNLHNTISDAESGIMLEGLLSDVPSYLDEESGIYKYGYGAQYTSEVLSNSKYLQLANAFNELAICKEGSTATRNLSIAQGVQNTRSEKLNKIYKSSNWVVFVEPKIDLDFFIKQSENDDDLIIIHYPDKNISSAGYSSITVTQKSNQYIEVIRDILHHELPLYTGDMNIERVICDFNAYSGEWLMNFINQKQLEEKVSLVSAINFCREYFAQEYCDYVWVPVALDEILRVTGSIGGTLTNVIFSKKALIKRGVIENQNATSDDLLMVGIKSVNGKVHLTYIPIEVKHGKCGQEIRGHAHQQVINTADLILKSFIDEPGEDQKTVDKKIYRNYMIQHIISNIEKMISYKLVDEQLYTSVVESSMRISLMNDLYELDINSDTDKYAFYFVEGETVTDRKRNSIDKVIEISTPIKSMYEYLIDQDRIREDVEDLIQNEIGTDTTDYDIPLINDDYEEDDDDDISELGDTESNSISERVMKASESINTIEPVEITPMPVSTTDNNETIYHDDNKHGIEDIRLLIGEDIKTKEKFYWEFGNKNLNNRHLLINGNSGCGKTYCIQALLMEAAQQGVSSVVFDYTGGFTLGKLDSTFKQNLDSKIVQRIVKNSKIPVNPFVKNDIQIDEDTFVPEEDADVANKISEIFRNVYDLGDQQKSAVYTAVRNGLQKYGDNMSFPHMVEELDELGSTYARSVISKIQAFTDFNPFITDEEFNWSDIRDSEGTVYIFQLAGYGRDIQVLLTELLLWDIWNFCVKNGDESKPFILVMDEAQNLSHSEKSPSAKILTEGRKFGVSGWYATQFMKPQLSDDEIQRLQQAGQKLYFCPPDDGVMTIAKNIDITPQGSKDWADQLKRLKKGECVTCGNMLRNGKWSKYDPRIVKITSLEERSQQ